MRIRLLLMFLFGFGALAAAGAERDFTVKLVDLPDEKAVFATVESPYVVPARARIGGTIASLSVRQGDAVKQDQAIAVVGDERLILQINSLDAQIAGLQSQLAQAQINLSRAQTLYRQGYGSKAVYDQANTAVEVATAALRARTAERASAKQNLQQGQVLAPVAGRVLTVSLTQGTVVLNGDTIATIAEEPFRLRLRIPERHALYLKTGDPIRLAAHQLGAESGAAGTITLVYPLIEDGRVMADAKVTGLGNYFVGDRVLVWINAGARPGYVVPEDFVETHFGIDYVRLRQPGGGIVDVPVQRGEKRATRALPDGLEILSGVHDGDVLVHP
ncbi:MAG TPA: efflux RND transporter periplasmic adaptor subunit [Stellaceae bacterium]|nr:efflux RND transporter periplasmic adaptor subunit [Stellaceae bacterium]